MPGTNQFLAFGNGVGANTLTPTAYAALTSLLSNGFQSGVANSAQFNTAFRQTTTMAAAIGQFIADQGFNANDDGSVANLKTSFKSGLDALYVLNSAFTGSNRSLTTSGYQKLPSGLIVQWGSFLIVSGGTYTGTFPITFPNSVFNFCVSASAGSGSPGPFFMNGDSISTSQFQVFGYTQPGTAANIGFRWVAFGY